MENPTENDRKPDNRAGCAVAEGSARQRHYAWVDRVTAEYARMYLRDSSEGNIILERARIGNLIYEHAPCPEQMTEREDALTRQLDECRQLLLEEQERSRMQRGLLESPEPSAPNNDSPFFGAVLHIDYQRICPSDKSGMVNIDCDGPQGWSYADVGWGHGIQIAEGASEEKTMRFCDALSMLVKEHFGEVTPLLQYNVNRHGRVSPNV